MVTKNTKKYNIEELGGVKSTFERILLKDREGNTVSANLVTPRSIASETVVIVPTGLGAIKENSSKSLLIPEFLKHNISTLVYDLFGHGESSGKIFDITPTKMINSLGSIIDFLKSKGFKNIVIYGSSGSSISCVVATVKFSPFVKLLVLQSPILDFKKMIIATRGKDGFKKWQERGYFIHLGYIGRRRIGFEYYSDSKKYDLEKDYLSSIKCKTLLTSAGNDNTAPPAQIEKIAAIIADSEYHFFENANHNYTNPSDRKRLNKLVVDFVVNNLSQT